MQTLLVVAIVLITLAIITQAGILIAMYLMSRRIGNKAEALIDDSKKLMGPLENAAANLKTVSIDLAQTGKIAREQAVHVQEFITEAQQNIRVQIDEVRHAVVDAVDEARIVAMRPIRQYSALATGVAEGIRTLFFGRRRPEEPRPTEEKHPAA